MKDSLIGLDIGGSKITGVVFSGKKILKAITVPTPKTLPSFKATVKKLVESLSLSLQVKGVGVGVAGVVDRQKCVLKFSPNLKFLTGLDFREIFSQFKRIKLENDAKCFAVAEHALGQGKAYKNFVGITLGTGIGAGVVINGQLYLGESGNAGEVGHAVLADGVSLESLYQKARDNSDYKKISILAGCLFANLYNSFGIKTFILGGGLAGKQTEKYLAAAVEISKKYILDPEGEVKVLVSEIPNAGAVGAALLFK